MVYDHRRVAAARGAVPDGYSIVLAREQDIAALPTIEVTAAQMLRGHAPQPILDEATSEEELSEAQAAGLLWVALRDDAPVGFALVSMLAADLPHLQEIDVHPAHGGRGVGAALVRTLCDWAERSGYREITLTTLRAVKWNMPFYARLGFEEVPAREQRRELIAVVAEETARGLDPAARVVMRWRARTGG